MITPRDLYALKALNAELERVMDESDCSIEVKAAAAFTLSAKRLQLFCAARRVPVEGVAARLDSELQAALRRSQLVTV